MTRQEKVNGEHIQHCEEGFKKKLFDEGHVIKEMTVVYLPSSRVFQHSQCCFYH